MRPTPGTGAQQAALGPHPNSKPWGIIGGKYKSSFIIWSQLSQFYLSQCDRKTEKLQSIPISATHYSMGLIRKTFYKILQETRDSVVIIKAVSYISSIVQANCSQLLITRKEQDWYKNNPQWHLIFYRTSTFSHNMKHFSSYHGMFHYCQFCALSIWPIQSYSSNKFSSYASSAFNKEKISFLRDSLQMKHQLPCLSFITP